MKQLYILLLLLGCSGLKGYSSFSRSWVTYFSDKSKTKITGIQYDTVTQSIYLVGITGDAGLATAGSHKPVFNSSGTDTQDIFIAKFDTLGNPLWISYYGGENGEYAPSIALDKWGDVYVVAYSNSTTGISSSGVYMPSVDTGGFFIAKFNSAEQRVWGTYVISSGNSSSVQPARIAIDQWGNAYIAGIITSSTIGTLGTHKPQLNPPANHPTLPISIQHADAFIIKINPTATAKLWGSYFGGVMPESLNDITVDHLGNCYIVGYTNSDTGIASPGAMITNSPQVGTSIGYIAKFNADGGRIWSSYLSNTNSIGISSAIDKNQNVYITGLIGIEDTSLPTTGVHQTIHNGASDLFLLKLNAAGQKIWGTYYGGSGNEMIENHIEFSNAGSSSRNSLRIAEEEQTAVYVSGKTNSNNYIEKGCVYQPLNHQEGFVAKFTGNGQLEWGSYYDAPVIDLASGKNKSIYIISNTHIDSLGTPGAWQATNPLQQHRGLLAKFRDNYDCPLATTSFTRINDTLIANTGFDIYKWFKNDTLVQNGSSNHYVLNGIYQGIYKVVAQDSCACSYISDTITINNPTSVINANETNRLVIQLSPNPFKDYVMLSGTLFKNENIIASIYNALGIKIKEETFSVKQGKVAHRINTSQLNVGVYYFKIKIGEQYFIEKLIKY